MTEVICCHALDSCNLLYFSKGSLNNIIESFVRFLVYN